MRLKKYKICKTKSNDITRNNKVLAAKITRYLKFSLLITK